MNKEEKITKIKNIINYLQETQHECYIKSIAHSEAGKYYGRLDKMIGLPIPIILSLSGAVSYATDPDVSKKDLSKSVLYSIAGVNILVAIISAVQQYFKYGQLSEKHLQSSFQYSTIYRKIKYFLHKQPKLHELEVFDESIHFKLNMAEEVSDKCPQKIVNRVKKENPREIDNPTESKRKLSLKQQNINQLKYFKTQTKRKKNQFADIQLYKLYEIDEKTLKDVAWYFTFTKQADNQGRIIEKYENIKNMDKEGVLNYIIIDLNIDYHTICRKIDEAKNGNLNMLENVEKRLITPYQSPLHTRTNTVDITRHSTFGLPDRRNSISLLDSNYDSELTFDDIVNNSSDNISELNDKTYIDDKKNIDKTVDDIYRRSLRHKKHKRYDSLNDVVQNILTVDNSKNNDPENKLSTNDNLSINDLV